MNKTRSFITTAIALAALSAASPAVAAPPSIAASTAIEGNVLSVPITHKCQIKKGCSYTAFTLPDTASDQTDFTSVTQTGSAKKGKTITLTLPIATTEDTLSEPTETFRVHVEVVHKNGTFDFDAVQTITDDDVAAPPPPPPADDNTPAYSSAQNDQRAVQTCVMPQRFGVNYQGGAWGAFLSGCTVRLTCPAGAQCIARSGGQIMPETNSGQRTTLNSRLYVQQANGQTAFNNNTSCDKASGCGTSDGIAIVGGQTAFTVCNGVRAVNPAIRAQVLCQIIVEVS